MPKKPERPGWIALAEPDTRKRERWITARDQTQWAVCGEHWDAVAIKPMPLGLTALSRMRLPQHRGYPVLADHLRGELYVMVEPGTGDTFAGLPGVRVLTRGHHLIIPRTEHGSPAADWLSAPRQDPPWCVPAARLARQIHALTNRAAAAAP
ncbi:hypothetical protein [Streptomyces syringium]|uniref:hypothetical protein n=1 Tax=Streptomyces syringium TaxID=76729 RepID=UPI003AAC4C99